MNKGDVTKTMLEGLVSKFNNNIVDKEQPLPTGKKKGDTKNKLEAELVGAANELLQPGDEQFFDEQDIDLMQAVGIDFAGLTGTGGSEAPEEVIDEAPAEEEVVEEEVVEEEVVEEEVVDEAPAAKEEKPKPKPKKKKAPADPTKTNKGQVYVAWVAGETDPEKLHKEIKEAVKLTTVKAWVKNWAKGKGLPKAAKVTTAA